MPQLGFDMQEGTLVRWLKQPGDAVQRGEPIAEIETDKAVIEIEAFESGTLTKLLVEEGTTVPVGEPIAVLDTGEEGEAADAAPTGPAPEPSIQPGGDPAAADGGPRVKASPLARRLAAEHGVNLRQLSGSGPGGRIVKADVLQAAQARPAAPAAPSAPAAEDRVVPLTRMRQTIAR